MIRPIFALIALALFAQVPSASAQYVESDELYYRIGGTLSVSRPVTLDPVNFGRGALLDGFSCGAFNPKLDVSSMLGNLTGSTSGFCWTCRPGLYSHRHLRCTARKYPVQSPTCIVSADTALFGTLRGCLASQCQRLRPDIWQPAFHRLAASCKSRRVAAPISPRRIRNPGPPRGRGNR